MATQQGITQNLSEMFTTNRLLAIMTVVIVGLVTYYFWYNKPCNRPDFTFKEYKSVIDKYNQKSHRYNRWLFLCYFILKWFLKWLC